MRVTPIAAPLPGEHLSHTSPVMRPETDDAAWRVRLDFWSGRSLTAEALDLEQENRAARMAWRGRLASSGIVTGLEVGLEPPAAPPDTLAPAGHFIHVLPGHGFLADGEDILVPRPLRVGLDQIPIHYVRVGGSNRTTPAEARHPDATAERRADAGGFVFNIDDFPSGHVPWAAVLLLCPAEFRTFERIDPTDPCELDPSLDAFADERRLDACLLRLCQVPVQVESRPELADRDDPRWRNRLAGAMFAEELLVHTRQHLRFRETQPEGERWDTVLGSPGLLRWGLLGVPLAVLSAERVAGTTRRRFFLDRSVVARSGGHARSRSRPALTLATSGVEGDVVLNPPGIGTPFTWRARVDQLAEHMGTLATATDADIVALASRFQFVPPAGFLPRSALSFLTTGQALALPPRPGQPPDRAGVNHFFPASFPVEAVPVAVEDLDAALASSAALAPYDLTSTDQEPVRVLVPLLQRVFDPRVLVVEQEDQIFAETVARFFATRQDWRQRRDFVRTRRDGLQTLITGPLPAATGSTFDPGQVEPEPVETIAALGFTAALLSPTTTSGPWEVRVSFAEARQILPNATLFLRLRVDQDSTPARVDVRWRTAQEERSFVWTEPPAPALERTDTSGQPLATPLWLLFAVPNSELALSGGVTGFTLHIDDGRLGLAAAGQLVPGQQAGQMVEELWWRAEDATPVAPEFTGGDWTRLTGDQLRAPFEDLFEPGFSDALTLDQRLDDLDAQLRLTGALRVRQTGLDALIARVVRELDQADDAVDLDFLKAQSNIHRIRQVMLGEEVANELLTSPTLGSIVNQKSARVAQEELLNTLKSMPSVPPPTTPPSGAAAIATFNVAAGIPIAGFADISGSRDLRVVNVADARLASVAEVRGLRTDLRVAAEPAAPVRDDVIASQASIGRGFELRTLTIAKRFEDGPTRNAYDFADTELRNTVGRIIRLLLEFDDNDPIPEVTDDAATPQPVSFGRLAREGGALLARLRFPALRSTDDSSAIFGQGVRRADATVLILRRLEFYIARKREQLTRGREVLAAVVAGRNAAAARVLAIEGTLAEARHDVSVARALRQEEQQRVAAINERRDGLIRNEVRFLAYVRPRALDLVRRRAQHWKLEPFDVPATMPACLRRHDEAPQPLNAYVQLFRHAPARWFTALQPLIARLNTAEKLLGLLDATRGSALSFASLDAVSTIRSASEAVQFTVLGAHQVISSLRQKSSVIQVADARLRSWKDLQRDAEEHAAVGDLIADRHGSREVSAAAAGELEQIGQVATCLHAEFAAVSPAVRLAWIERFSQFDRPALLRDLTVLPHYGRLDRSTRRRLQEFVDWLFGRITTSQRDAVSLMNDLVRLCLLLASHAPVARIIAGHVPRPTPVRPGLQIPIRPLNPELVRVGMEFHVWQASRIVARGRVEDLRADEVSARVDHVEAQTTTIDTTMRVQFVPAALSLIR